MTRNKRIKTDWSCVEAAIIDCDLGWAREMVQDALDYRMTVSPDNVSDPMFGKPPKSAIVCELLKLLDDCEDMDDIRWTFTVLLKLGCDPTIRDEEGNTALHIIMKEVEKWDFSWFFKTLIDFVPVSKRASFVNATDGCGKPAILYLKFGRHSGWAVCDLLKSGVDPFVGDRTGTVILHKLLKSISFLTTYEEGYDDEPDDGSNEAAFLEAMTKLLNLGCSPMGRNQEGMTSLHLLTEYHVGKFFHRFVEVLVSSCVALPRDRFVNAMDDKGKTALYFASYKNDADKVNTLLEFGADPYVGDPTGSCIRDMVLRSLDDDDFDLLPVFRLLPKIDPTTTFLFLQKMATLGRRRIVW